MELLINQQKHHTAGAPDQMLLWVLRDELGLTGTKYGCGEGECGACTVLLDGEPARSCLTTLRAASGRKITTIEGLEHNGHLHPLQEAFVKVDAMQCGYCTTGMILAGAGLLSRNPNPSEREIVAALQGNICRCGTYPRIVEAVRLAAKGGA